MFGAGVGLWLALALIKFGNPIIFEQQILPPSTPSEAQAGAWPPIWGFCLSEVLVLVGLWGSWGESRRSWWLLGALTVGLAGHWFFLSPQILLWDLGLVALALLVWSCWRRPAGLPRWLMFAPLVWLGWQVASALIGLEQITQEGARRILLITLVHFTICVLIFFFGASIVDQRRTGDKHVEPRPETFRLFWLALAGGFLVVLAIGWRQHFGGLEETRVWFFKLPDWRSYPPEFIQKLSSDRISGTLFYPNTLAGAILLLLPALLARLWTSSMAPLMRRAAVMGVATLALGALYWSGSKAGWLILLVQGAAAIFCLSRAGRTRSLVLLGILVLGLVGFGLRYRSYLESGAKSLSARFDYWEAAWKGLQLRPVWGSGPGTFATTYRQLKRPESEMARLTHNDFLQQGSDSGWVGMLSYGVWLLGGLGALAVRLRPKERLGEFGTWIGLAGLSLQALLEFWLYIPAIAWTAFFLLGLGFASGNRRPEHCLNGT